MDYIDIQQLKARGALADKYNMAISLIEDIRSTLSLYEQDINTSLEEAEDLYIVSEAIASREANINAALEGLGNAQHTLNTWRNK